MAKLLWLAAAFVVMGSVAGHAQGAPPMPPGPPPEPDMPHPPMMEHGGMGMHRGMMPMPPRAAGFRFRKDGAEISIRCAANEPTRACVDAASILIDKVAATMAAH